MSWKTVAICDRHWLEEEGERPPHRFVVEEDEQDLLEPCYRCEKPECDIFVRREVED